MKTRLERGKDMKNKKGFTLIELLAVIVILAIIALIAVPVVMNIIGKANKSAFKDSAYGLLKAGENYYMDSLLKAEGMTDDKVFDFSNDTSDLEINGSKPTGGEMIVNTNGKIAMAIHNGKHCVTKGFEDDDVIITDDVENCKLPMPVLTLSDLATTGIFESTNGTNNTEVTEVNACIKDKTAGACVPGTAFAIKVNDTETYKFYVLNDTGSEVTLIMNRNLYGEEDLANNTHNVAWYLDGDDNTNDETNASGPLTALSVLKERTRGWTNIPKFTYTLEDDADRIGVDNLYPSITGKLVTNVRARLPRLSEINPIMETNNGFPPDYLIDNLDDYSNRIYGYWLSTAYSFKNTDALIVYCQTDNLDILSSTVFNKLDYGIRPVITLSK